MQWTAVPVPAFDLTVTSSLVPVRPSIWGDCRRQSFRNYVEARLSAPIAYRSRVRICCVVVWALGTFVTEQRVAGTGGRLLSARAVVEEGVRKARRALVGWSYFWGWSPDSRTHAQDAFPARRLPPST